jgi:hypothetical protein
VHPRATSKQTNKQTDKRVSSEEFLFFLAPCVTMASGCRYHRVSVTS